MRKNPGAEAEIYAKIHIYRDNRELNEMETQRENSEGILHMAARCCC